VIKFFFSKKTKNKHCFSVNELFVDAPEIGTAERIPVHIDISVLEIACQCNEMMFLSTIVLSFFI
jgi:hypothetical protein